ncbi:hypothetical protein JNUCC64_17340 [Streptomyces sp. JNUCC 64]
MNTAVKISAYAAALAVAFGTAYGVGNGVDPVNSEPAAHQGHATPGGKGAASGAASEAGSGSGSGSGSGPGSGSGKEAGGGAEAPGGLQVAERGYAVDLRTPRVAAGRTADLEFVIRDGEGDALTSFKREHGKDLHLIVASRDLNTYRHLHPVRAADGTWSTPVKLPRAGDYRLFADFTPGPDASDGGASGNLTLGADLAVSGDYRPTKVPAASRTATVDGYRVTLEGALRPGSAEELRLKVTKGGRDVTDLQPYLGAYGHLVALRSGDLGYLHVHPNGEPGDGTTEPGPEVSFTATAPSAGTYRLFLDFQHGGEVRTAAFTVRAAGGAGGSDGSGEQGAPGGSEGSEGSGKGAGSGSGSGEAEGDGHQH